MNPNLPEKQIQIQYDNVSKKYDDTVKNILNIDPTMFTPKIFNEEIEKIKSVGLSPIQVIREFSSKYSEFLREYPKETLEMILEESTTDNSLHYDYEILKNLITIRLNISYINNQKIADKILDTILHNKDDIDFKFCIEFFFELNEGETTDIVFQLDKIKDIIVATNYDFDSIKAIITNQYINDTIYKLTDIFKDNDILENNQQLKSLVENKIIETIKNENNIFKILGITENKELLENPGIKTAIEERLPDLIKKEDNIYDILMITDMEELLENSKIKTAIEERLIDLIKEENYIYKILEIAKDKELLENPKIKTAIEERLPDLIKKEDNINKILEIAENKEFNSIVELKIISYINVIYKLMDIFKDNDILENNQQLKSLVENKIIELLNKEQDIEKAFFIIKEIGYNSDYKLSSHLVRNQVGQPEISTEQQSNVRRRIAYYKIKPFAIKHLCQLIENQQDINVLLDVRKKNNLLIDSNPNLKTAMENQLCELFKDETDINVLLDFIKENNSLFNHYNYKINGKSSKIIEITEERLYELFKDENNIQKFLNFINTNEHFDYSHSMCLTIETPLAKILIKNNNLQQLLELKSSDKFSILSTKSDKCIVVSEINKRIYQLIENETDIQQLLELRKTYKDDKNEVNPNYILEQCIDHELIKLLFEDENNIQKLLEFEKTNKFEKTLEEKLEIIFPKLIEKETKLENLLDIISICNDLYYWISDQYGITFWKVNPTMIYLAIEKKLPELIEDEKNLENIIKIFNIFDKEFERVMSCTSNLINTHGIASTIYKKILQKLPELLENTQNIETILDFVNILKKKYFCNINEDEINKASDRLSELVDGQNLEIIVKIIDTYPNQDPNQRMNDNLRKAVENQLVKLYKDEKNIETILNIIKKDKNFLKNNQIREVTKDQLPDLIKGENNIYEILKITENKDLLKNHKIKTAIEERLSDLIKKENYIYTILKIAENKYLLENLEIKTAIEEQLLVLISKGTDFDAILNIDTSVYLLDNIEELKTAIMKRLIELSSDNYYISKFLNIPNIKIDQIIKLVESKNRINSFLKIINILNRSRLDENTKIEIEIEIENHLPNSIKKADNICEILEITENKDLLKNHKINEAIEERLSDLIKKENYTCIILKIAENKDLLKNPKIITALKDRLPDLIKKEDSIYEILEIAENKEFLENHEIKKAIAERISDLIKEEDNINKILNIASYEELLNDNKDLKKAITDKLIEFVKEEIEIYEILEITKYPELLKDNKELQIAITNRLPDLIKEENSIYEILEIAKNKELLENPKINKAIEERLPDLIKKEDSIYKILEITKYNEDLLKNPKIKTAIEERLPDLINKENYINNNINNIIYIAGNKDLLKNPKIKKAIEERLPNLINNKNDINIILKIAENEDLLKNSEIKTAIADRLPNLINNKNDINRILNSNIELSQDNINIIIYNATARNQPLSIDINIILEIKYFEFLQNYKNKHPNLEIEIPNIDIIIAQNERIRDTGSLQDLCNSFLSFLENNQEVNNFFDSLQNIDLVINKNRPQEEREHALNTLRQNVRMLDDESLDSLKKCFNNYQALEFQMNKLSPRMEVGSIVRSQVRDLILANANLDIELNKTRSNTPRRE